MKRSMMAIVSVVAILAAAGMASAGPLASISGTITPTHQEKPQSGWTATANFGILADTTVVDAQTQTVTVSGTIGTLPTNSGYWLEIGLVPKSVYDNPDYGFLPYIFNKGALLYTKYSGGNFEVGLLHQQADPLAICVNPVTNDGSIAFSFTLTPSGAAGGSGTMVVDGTTATYGGSTTLAYHQDLTQSYLVGMVWVDSGALSPVTISATATPEPATMALLALGGIGMLLRRKRGCKA